MKGIFFIPIENKRLDYAFILEKIKKETVLSEGLGLSEAFFGEHLTDRHERLSSSLMMIAALSKVTNKIKLGTMTANLTFYNPALMACLISTVDNLTLGRLLLGIGSGSNSTDIEFTGNSNKDNFSLMIESLSIIKELLQSKGVVDIKSENFSISTKKNASKALQLGFLEGLFKRRENLEVIMPTLGLNSKSVEYCAQNNLSIISSNFCNESILKNHIEQYTKESKLTNSEVMKKIRLCRFIFICEKESDVDKYLYCEDSPYLNMIDVIYQKLKTLKKHYIFGADVRNSLDATKEIVITGTPGVVSEKISELMNKMGYYKSLVYAATSFSEKEIYANSLKLFGKHVSI